MCANMCVCGEKKLRGMEGIFLKVNFIYIYSK